MAKSKQGKREKRQRKKTIWISLLNVVSQPHDKAETYTDLFLNAARGDVSVRYAGDRYARVGTATKGKDDPMLMGEIWTFTRISPNSPMMNLNERRDLDPEEIKAIKFDWAAHGLNSRKVVYALDTKKHRLGFESNTMSPRTLAPVLQAILNIVVKDTGTKVFVNVVQSPHALEDVLALKLQRLEIRISPPNADSSKWVEDFEDEMQRQNAVAEVKILEAAPGEELKPDEETLMRASVGISHGYVRGKGKDPTTGRTRDKTTADSPVREPFILNPKLETLIDVVKAGTTKLVDTFAKLTGKKK